MRTSAEFKVAHIRNWNLVVRWACRSIGFLAILLTAGCLSHDVSSRHAAIVGKEFITARDYYVIDGQVLTNVLLNTHQPAWIVEDMAYAERHYGFSPGTGIRKGNYDYSYALLPAGTKLSVEAVKRNNLVDAGVETVVVGSMAHPVTKQRVRWAFYLSTHGETIKRAPWEPDSVPASRPASEPWNAIHVLPQR